MDDLTNRIMAVAFALLWIFAILLVILLVWNSPDASIVRIGDLAGYLDDHNTTEAKLIITFGGAILVLLATLLILFELVPPETNSLKIQQVGGGEVEISADEAVLRIEEELRLVPQVDQVQAKIVGKGKKAELSLTLHVTADANLANTADEAVARATSFIEEKMGIQLAKPPSAEVHYRELRVGSQPPVNQPASVAESSPAQPTAVGPPATEQPQTAVAESPIEQPPAQEATQESSDAPREDPAAGA